MAFQSIWKPLEGKYPEADLEVLRMDSGTQAKDTVYVIYQECCNSKMYVRHASLKSRIRNKIKHCRICSYRIGYEKKMGKPTRPQVRQQKESLNPVTKIRPVILWLKAMQNISK